MTVLPWCSVHAFLDGGATAEDALLLDAVVPAIRDLGRPDLEWFFIRYWEGGPHLRIRLRGSADEIASVHDRVAQAAGRVARIDYEPETARYGGPDGLAVSETFFRDSSEFAAAIVAKTPDPASRAGAALELLIAYTVAITPSALDAVRLLRSYATGLAYVGEGPPVDVPSLVRRAEAEYVARGAALRDRFDRLSARLTPELEPESLVDHWYLRARALATAYRDLRADGRLVGDVDRILLSQLHMFHNRLAVLLPEEAYLAWLVSHLFARANPVEDYRADGPDVADRSYHEASKMFASRMWDIPGLGGRHATSRRWVPPWARETVPLPSVESSLDGASLADVLTQRRSCYGTYDGLTLDELATLLRYGAGTSRVVRYPQADGAGPTVGLRSYPSAGARYAVGLAVVARDVEGLAPAVYAYDADQHALRRIRELPPVEDIARMSPMFGTGGDPATIDVLAAPAVLAFVGELTYQREKYGIRAYRLLLLEAGHLAQNVSLVATALGLATVPLGSFFDDAASQLVFADGVNESVVYLMPLGRYGPGVRTAPPAVPLSG